MVSNKLFCTLRVLGVCLFALLASGCERLIVLNSKGPIGREETTLIYLSVGAMLIVIVPVFVMTYLFVKRYRASNNHGDYRPDFVHSTKVELVIWLVPVMIILFLSYLVWVKTIELDPYKPIASENEPLNIQVISLDWNWLFIYPDYDIAMINELVIPEQVPLNFRLTSATVMTSMFIPQLGSQMYAMAGMQTKLHLMADETGTFAGHNIEFSGEGYDTMHFAVVAKTREDFDQWAREAKTKSTRLDMATYTELSKPSTNYPITVFSAVEPGLFQHVMQSFMGWMGDMDGHQQMNGMNGHQQMHGMDEHQQMSGMVEHQQMDGMGDTTTTDGMDATKP
ncbi:MAG: ubiquinol oxidase subunit II [Desulfopila sp.]